MYVYQVAQIWMEASSDIIHFLRKNHRPLSPGPCCPHHTPRQAEAFRESRAQVL